MDISSIPQRPGRLPKRIIQLATAEHVFANTGVQVTSEGRPYLGAAIGTRNMWNHNYVKDKVVKWSAALNNLATIAVTQPHAAYTAFTHGF